MAFSGCFFKRVFKLLFCACFFALKCFRVQWQSIFCTIPGRASPSNDPASPESRYFPGTRDCFAEAPRQTLQQIRAKRCSDGASRSVINISHCRFWVHRACFVFGLSVFWASLAKCAKTESSEPICLRSPLTSFCI